MRRCSAVIAATAAFGIVVAGCESSAAADSPIVTSDPGEELHASVSADGSAVVFDKLTAPGNSDIYLIRGNEAAVNLTADSPANDFEPALSPDGEQVAFRSGREGGGIFVMSAAGGAARRLSEQGASPRWTPDGREVLYSTVPEGPSPYNTTAASFMWAVDVESGERRQLSTDWGVAPRASPNGERVAFWALGDRKSGSQRDIWTMRMDGTDAVRVTNDQAVDWSPVWSPEGDMLYFASDRDGGAMKIFRVAIDQSTGVTSGEPQVVGDDAGAPMRGHLSMSDDGVLTYVDRSVNRAMFRLSLGADGAPEGEPVRISDPSVSPSGFSVSPDGEWVAFVLGDNNQEDVFVMRADGSELKQLTNDPHRDRGATWSPDSRTIAFRSDRPAEGTSGGPVYEHWQIARDGTGLRKITSIDVGAANPVFAPNGRSIAMFHRNAAGGDDLLLMDPDGSNVRTVATSAQGFGAPIWSPDSRRLAFRELQGSSGRAHLLDVTRAGATPEPLPEMDFNPLEWLSDGSAIVGNHLATDRPAQAVVYDVAARRFEELSGGGAEWLPGGRQIVSLRDGNTVIQVIDRATKAARELVTVQQPNSVTPFNLSPDGRVLYYIQTQLEADIHRMVP